MHIAKRRTVGAVAWGVGAMLACGGVWADEPPAAPQPPPLKIKFDGGMLASKRLWPRFEKGQKSVLRQTVQKSRRGTTQIASRIAVEVVDKAERDWIVRWQVTEIEVPADLPEDQRRAAAAMVAAMKSPPIDLAVTEGLGTVRLVDWEKAREDLLAHSVKLMKETPQPEPLTEEKMQEALATMRSRMGTREDTEFALLKEIRPYFDGAYHELEPGGEAEEPVLLPMPMGGVKAWPATRTVRVDEIDPAKPEFITVRIDAKLNREEAAGILKSMAEKAAAAGSDTRGIPTAESLTMGYTLAWTLDRGPRGKGWPVEVKYRTEQKVGDRGAWEEYSWTLVEGPTGGAPAAAAPSGAGTNP